MGCWLERRRGDFGGFAPIGQEFSCRDGRSRPGRARREARGQSRRLRKRPVEDDIPAHWETSPGHWRPGVRSAGCGLWRRAGSGSTSRLRSWTNDCNFGVCVAGRAFCGPAPARPSALVRVGRRQLGELALRRAEAARARRADDDPAVRSPGGRHPAGGQRGGRVPGGTGREVDKKGEALIRRRVGASALSRDETDPALFLAPSGDAQAGRVRTRHLAQIRGRVRCAESGPSATPGCHFPHRGAARFLSLWFAREPFWLPQQPDRYVPERRVIAAI